MRSVQLLCVALAAGFASAAPVEVNLDVVGDIQVDADDVSATFIAGLVEGSGPSKFSTDLKTDPDPETCSVGLRLVAGRPASRVMSGRGRLLSVSNDVVEISGDFKALKDTELSGGIGIVVKFPARSWGGAEWRSDCGFSGIMPQTYRTFPLGGGTGRRIEFCRKDGLRIAMEFPTSVSISAFDGRAYGGTGTTFRFLAHGGERLAKGASAGFACRMRRQGGLRTGCTQAVVVRPGDEWVPFTYRKDIVEGSALDFSRLGFHDAPAGRHGRVRSAGGHFEFEGLPGRAQRFYGVNLCGDANCPEKSLTDQLVRRFVRLGYNAIRIHHHEKSLLVGSDGGREFDKTNLDRFDYLIAKAVENGIYITTDLFVSRPVTWKAIGENRPGSVSGNEYKSLLVLGHPGAFADWRDFATRFLTHVNPYTGRSLAEEPALITLGLVNEGHLGMGWSRVRKTEFAQKVWNEWRRGRSAAEMGLAEGTVPERAAELGKGVSDAGFALFQRDLELRKVRAMTEVVRQLGYEGLLFNDNNGPVYVAKETVRAEATDVVDNHCYVDHPHFIGANWSQPSAIEGANPFFAENYVPARLGAMRLYGKPFTVTEWNHSSVGSFRSTAGLLVGSIAAGQDWAGLWRFAYAHGSLSLKDDGGSVSSFDLAGDPLKQATDRTFVLLFLRGDVPVLKERMAFGISRSALYPQGAQALRLELPAWTRKSVFEAQMGSVVEGGMADGADVFPVERVVATVRAPKDYGMKGPVAVDWSDGSFSLTTPLTCGGFCEAGRGVSAGALTFALRGHRATVSASSLDGHPIAESARILVTHLSDVLGEGGRFANDRHTVILAHGKSARPLMRAGTAEIKLALRHPEAYDVWALDTAGSRERMVSCRSEDGRLRFEAKIERGSANMYYEVVRK